MRNYHLAIDIGASSGRHILGWLENGKIRLEEIHRFSNGMVQKNGQLCWELDKLFNEVMAGLKRCNQLVHAPVTVGIDTWGVDFVLLDKDNKILGDTVAYRDARTQGIDQEVFKVIPEKELYSRSGIQKLEFNTIYQLYSLKLSHPELLEKAESFLMIPDYLNFLLTGVKANEYTNATTTQLVHAINQNWDFELIERLGLPTKIFCDIKLPKHSLGSFTAEIQEELGFNANVVLPATHDTGSAVLAVPTKDEDAIYISSGTWSLMGIERFIPDCTENSRTRNFTNEGGYHYRYRFLKNIMGLWMLQSIRSEFKHQYTFPEITTLAGIGMYFEGIIDNVNAPEFLAPKSMIEAIKNYCKKTGQEVPETECEILACTYKSLARCYAHTVKEIEEVTGQSFSRIHLIGGGCQDTLLNKLTAEYTGKEVYAGPIEATALGNIIVQMLSSGELKDLPAAREAVMRSFTVEKVGKLAS